MGLREEMGEGPIMEVWRREGMKRCEGGKSDMSRELDAGERGGEEKRRRGDNEGEECEVRV